MARRLANVLGFLSLLLFAVVLLLWVRSYLPDHLWFRWVDGRLVVVAARDGLGAVNVKSYLSDEPSTNGGLRALLNYLRAGVVPSRPLGAPPLVLRRELGVERITVYFTAGNPPVFRVVTIPGAYLALVTAVPPLLWLAVWFRRRGRVGAGRCTNCGYDLRASPGRCPECGTAPATGQVQAAA